MIGGKLTTFRAFAEQTADKLLARLGKPRLVSTREKHYPGAEGYPQDEAAKRQWIARVAAASGIEPRRVAAHWHAMAQRQNDWPSRVSRSGTALMSLPDYTLGKIRMIAENEQVLHLSDLVRRRSVITLLGQATEPALAELATIVGKVLGWDEALQNEEIALALSEARGRK